MNSKVCTLFVVLIVFTLAACQGGRQSEEAASTLEAEVQVTLQPTSSPATPEPATEESAGEEVSDVASAPTVVSEATAIDMEEVVSITKFFCVQAPTGWHKEEAIPGANLVLANSEMAFERYSTGSTIESGDLVVNIGFLPLTLLQDDQLSHLGFQFEASPEIFLQSLLPMFRIGNEPAADVAGEPTRVSIGDGRDAGMLTLSDEGREGLILVFAAGDGVIAFVSAIGFPGEMDAFQETVYAVTAQVEFSGAQDALYGALYGG